MKPFRLKAFVPFQHILLKNIKGHACILWIPILAGHLLIFSKFSLNCFTDNWFPTIGLEDLPLMTHSKPYDVLVHCFHHVTAMRYFECNSSSYHTGIQFGYHLKTEIKTNKNKQTPQKSNKAWNKNWYG